MAACVLARADAGCRWDRRTAVGRLWRGTGCLFFHGNQEEAREAQQHLAVDKRRIGFLDMFQIFGRESVAMVSAGMVEIGTQARTLHPFDDGSRILKRMIVIGMPDIQSGRLADQPVVIGRRCGKGIAAHALLGKGLAPRAVLAGFLHHQMAWLGQIVGHLHGKHAAGLQPIHQTVENIEMVRQPLKDGIGKEEVDGLIGTPACEIGLGEGRARHALARGFQHVVVAIEAGDAGRAVSLDDQFRRIAGAATKVDRTLHALQRHLRQQIACGARAFILEFHILAGRPCHEPILFLDCIFQRLNPDLVDISAIEFDHFEGESARVEALALVRQVTETPQDEAGERRIAIALVDEVDADQFREVTNVDPSVDGQRSVLALVDRQPLVLLAGEFAGDGLKEIRRRHQSFDFAIFVEDQRHGLILVAQPLHQLEHADALMHGERLADGALQIDLALFHQVAQDVACAGDADEIVEAAADDREARMADLDDTALLLLARLVEVEPDDIRARRHDRARRAVGKRQHAMDHVLLLGGEHLFADGLLGRLFRCLAERSLRPLGAEKAEHGIGGAIADIAWRNQPLLVAAGKLVQRLDDDREADGGIEIALRHMEAEAFDDERETDHHQEAEAEDDHGRMFRNEGHQRLRQEQHDADREDHGNHHDGELLHHAHGRDDTVEREDRVEHDDLHDHLPEDGVNELLFALRLMPFQPFMQLHRALEQQEQAAENQDEVAAGQAKAPDGEQRRRQRHHPGDRGEECQADDEGQRQADHACGIALVRRQLVGQNRDENEIVDTENNLENDQGSKTDPGGRVGYPVEDHQCASLAPAGMGLPILSFCLSSEMPRANATARPVQPSLSGSLFVGPAFLEQEL
ncbi:hypothetical protein RHSP_33312 [Rhizobium freirei PRF 81]|uniref:Uncharacterized protein n=1 Tax=Rhizobium freirei PRF 81 TaxID=363754 RepID=N6U7C0_9HYPH|nr:hypothetical protein RHSP_33312 [Rhizobium freirei PRF 81]